MPARQKKLLLSILAVSILTVWLLILSCGDDEEKRGEPEFVPIMTGLGISTHISTGDSEAAGAKRENELLLTRDIGVKVLRRDFLWRDIEPEKGKFSFERYDTIVDEAQQYGQKFIGLLTYSVPWAQSEPGNDSSIDPQDFADFVKATVEHFKGRVELWEIWNEPNFPRFWKPQPDPEAYGNLLKHAYTAAKEADPDCRVAFGGMAPLHAAPDYWKFLEEVYAQHPDIGDYFDVMAFHIYTFFQSESPELETTMGSVSRMIGAIKDILKGHGDDDRALWITELGWPAAPEPPPFAYIPNVTYAEQAEYLVRAFIIALSEGVEIVCWYTFTDGTGGSPSSENYFGLVKYDPDPLNPPPPELKESYRAYQTMAEALGDTEFIEDLRVKLDLQEDEYAFLFEDETGSKRATALWKASEGESREIIIPISGGDQSEVVGMLGDKTEINSNDETLMVRISNEPIYVVEIFN